MQEMRRNLALESCGGHHSTLDVWRIRMTSADLMSDRDFASSIG